VAATMAATGGEPRLLQRIEIVGDRRRVHDAAFRDVVVAASGASGARVQEVAERHGICPSLVYRWRRAAAAAALGDGGARLLPVRIVGESAPAQPAQRTPASSSPAPRPCGVIEIELAAGVRVRVDEAVSVPALRRVLAVLRG
jgi:transposase